MEKTKRLLDILTKDSERKKAIIYVINNDDSKIKRYILALIKENYKRVKNNVEIILYLNDNKFVIDDSMHKYEKFKQVYDYIRIFCKTKEKDISNFYDINNLDLKDTYLLNCLLYSYKNNILYYNSEKISKSIRQICIHLKNRETSIEYILSNINNKYCSLEELLENIKLYKLISCYDVKIDNCKTEISPKWSRYLDDNFSYTKKIKYVEDADLLLFIGNNIFDRFEDSKNKNSCMLKILALTYNFHLMTEIENYCIEEETLIDFCKYVKKYSKNSFTSICIYNIESKDVSNETKIKLFNTINDNKNLKNLLEKYIKFNNY